MASSNRDRIGKMFELVAPPLDEFILRSVASRLNEGASWTVLIQLKDEQKGVTGKEYHHLDPQVQLRMLTENVRRAMQLEPVRDREGNPVGQYIYQGAVANKALELLGKELGMFQPKPVNQGPDIHEMMARLHKGRERNAQAKMDRDAAAAEAQKKIAANELGRDVAAPDDPIRPAS